MKKLVLPAVIFLILVFNSCCDDSNKATVRINLGNMTIAKQVEKKSFIDKVLSIFVKDAYAQTLPLDLGVMKLHFAAYDDGNLIAKDGIDTAGMLTTNNIVEFKVSPGENITILIVGEDSSNQAAYYGYNYADLKAGETTEISITMTVARWDGSLDVNGVARNVTSTNMCSAGPYNITWSSAGVKVRYIIIDNSADPVIKYSGYGSEYIDYDSNNYQFYVEFEDFNLRTIGESINNC